MDNTEWQINAQLDNQWNEFVLRMEQLHNSVDFSSRQSPISFGSTDGDYITFDCAPVSINLPERGGGVMLPLFLVLRGNLTFNKRLFRETNEIRTSGFATETAYFRLNGSNQVLRHVYGAHYDLDSSLPGHPRFHVQHRSFQDVFEHEVRRHVGGKVVMEDAMTQVLNTVRIPCAQMDFFSVLLQAVGDRLMSNPPNAVQVSTFKALVENSKSILGCGYLFSSMSNTTAMNCYRASHWY